MVNQYDDNVALVPLIGLKNLKFGRGYVNLFRFFRHILAPALGFF